MLRQNIARQKSRGQTALEYAMIMTMTIIPLALAIRTMLEDSKDEAHDNATRRITNTSYGDEKRMGTIGRPYP